VHDCPQAGRPPPPLPELPPLLAPALQNQVPGLWQLHVAAFANEHTAPTT
jgi:hypothetical protein